MAYKVIILYRLYMPSYVLGTFTEYPYHNPTDTLTLITFENSFHERYNRFPLEGVADSGYGSEENYSYVKTSEYPPNCSRLTQQDLIIRELEEKRRSWADS